MAKRPSIKRTGTSGGGRTGRPGTSNTKAPRHGPARNIKHTGTKC